MDTPIAEIEPAATTLLATTPAPKVRLNLSCATRFVEDARCADNAWLGNGVTKGAAGAAGVVPAALALAAVLVCQHLL